MPNPFKLIGEAGRAVLKALHREGTPPPNKTWAKGVQGDMWRVPDEQNRKARQKAVGLAVVGRVDSERSLEYAQLLQQAAERVSRLFGYSAEDAPGIVALLTNHMDLSDLTVNFQAYEMGGKGWFAKPCPYESYKQAYEIFKGTDERGNPIDMFSSMMAGSTTEKRDKDEMAKIVHAEPQRGKMLSGAVGRFSQVGGLKDVEGEKVGSYKAQTATNPNFLAASRPRYAAL